MPLLRLSGTIKFYNPDRGYGFIYADDEKLDVFFHITSVKGPNPPSVGDKVSFYLKESEGRWTAYDAEITLTRSKTERAKKTEKTLDGFPCIRGGSIRGFRVAKVMAELTSSKRHSVEEARTNLINQAKSVGANAVFNYVWHRENELRNAWFLIWHVGKYREITYWAEGNAVKLVPD